MKKFTAQPSAVKQKQDYELYFIFIIFVLLYLLIDYYKLDNIIIEDMSTFILLAGILPLKVYENLSSKSTINNLKLDLHRVGGVYGIINISDPKNIKQYIGSSKDLYQRLSDHLNGRDSNSRLQRSISKYGIDKFHLVIYYFHYDTSVILTDIETKVIKSFPFENLYNYKKEASSSLGYKHTIEAIKKMKKRFLIKSNHPMFGKKHDEFALAKISKPGVLNPMFGKKHTNVTKQKMSLVKSKINLGLYDLDNNLIKTFINQVELAKYLNLHKSTISRYLKSGNLLLNKYFIRKV